MPTYVLKPFRTPPRIEDKPERTSDPADGQDPNLELTGEPDGPLWRADDYAADNPNSPRINATLLSLVRNSEVGGMVQAMRDLERTWNHKFNYPWTFFNDEPFDDNFKKLTRAATKAKCNYGMREGK
ncbi:MAG: hypothetical protein Q9187_007101 [Circinaria calcarea]